MEKLIGSCLCKSCRFEVRGDLDGFMICHCSYCRKDSGSAFAANIFANAAQLNWISGESQICRYNLPDTHHINCFCSTCGSSLPYVQKYKGRDLLVIPAGSLDCESPRSPDAHIHYGSRSKWEDKLSQISIFEGSPRS